MASELDNASVYTDFSGLRELHREAKSKSPDALRKTAQQFEAIFLQMVLKSMRDASFGDDLFGSYESKFYRGMFDQQVALTMAQGKGIGLTDVIVRQLQHGAKQSADAANAKAVQDVQAPPTAAALPLGVKQAAPVHTAASTENSQATKSSFDSPADFVRAIWKHAMSAAKQLGLDPQALVAQAALETGWGKHMPAQPDGTPSNNLFGIKADGRWQGQRVNAVTTEFDQGVVRRETAQFRAYPSLEAGFADYVRFLRSDPRYRSAVSGATAPQEFGQALSRAGYATDPDYGAKIRNIMDSDTLRQAMQGLNL